MRPMRIACVAMALIGACGAARVSVAQEFPHKPIRFVIGPSPDLLARLLGQRLTEMWGQPLVIDIRPGAGGAIATETVARAAPDGYSWLLTSSSFVVNQVLTPKPQYDLRRDLAPVSLMVLVPFVLVANPALPAKTLAELIALARAKPGQLNYASSGNGTTPHLALEMLKGMAKIDLVHVPYKGVAPALTDTIGGQVQVFLSAQQAALPQIKAGKVRALAVSGARRSRALPEVPTIAESGFPGFDVNGWLGLHLPLKTPRALIARIHDDIARALGPADVQERILTSGMEPVTMTSAEFDTWVRNDFARYRRVASDAHIRAE